MKRILLVAIFLILALSLVAACARPAPTTTPAPVAKPAPAPSPSPSPAATPKPTAAPQVFVLKFSLHSPGASSFAKSQDWYLTEVEKRTNGRVKFERYWSESLVPARELLQAISAGAADSGGLVGEYTPAKTPLLTLGNLPALYGDIYPAAMAWHDLYKEIPAMNQELAQYNARFMSAAVSSAYVILTTKPVNTLADLKGMKLRAMGDQSVLLKELGGVPVSMTGPESTQAMERGTIEGVIMAPSALIGYGLHEKGKYLWEMPFGGNGTTMAINAGVWNKLPADIQKIMQDVALEHAKPFHQIYQVEFDGAAMKTMTDKGVKVSTPSAAHIAKVREVARQVVWDKWVKDKEDKYLPGKQVLDTFVRLNEKYIPLSPFKK